jgi:hypothetical protein
MIAKTITSTNFSSLCEYLIGNREFEAKVLMANEVRFDTPKHMSEDFLYISNQRLSKTKCAQHFILSFPKFEEMDDHKAISIAQEFLKEVKITNSQYSIISHSGVKEHFHLHIACNLVNLDLNSINDSFMGVRCKKAAIAITKKYGLIEIKEKTLAYTNLDALNMQERTKAEIYFTCKELLKCVTDIDEFKIELNKVNIKLSTVGKKGSNDIIGLKFSSGIYNFKGSQVHRSLSLKGVIDQININKQELLKESTAENKETIKRGTSITDTLTGVEKAKAIVPDEYIKDANPKDIIKQEIIEAIKLFLTSSPTVQVFQDKLANKGIETVILKKQSSGIVKGILFKKNDVTFKGSELHREYSISNILKIISRNPYTNQKESLKIKPQQNNVIESNHKSTGKKTIEPLFKFKTHSDLHSRIADASSFLKYQADKTNAKSTLIETIQSFNLRGVSVIPVFQTIDSEKVLKTVLFKLISDDSSINPTLSLNQISSAFKVEEFKSLFQGPEQMGTEILDQEQTVPGIYFSYEPSLVEFFANESKSKITPEIKEFILNNNPQLETEISYCENLQSGSGGFNEYPTKSNHSLSKLFADYGGPAPTNQGVDDILFPQKRKKLRH